MSIVVREIEHDGRRIVLVGTTVVSPKTLHELAELIADVDAERVVVDYDETRWKWLQRLSSGDDLDLVGVLRSGEMIELNSRLAMGIVAKWTAPRAGVREDAEYRVAVEAAADRVVFARRPVEVEGLRAWRIAKPLQRIGLAWRLVVGSCRSTRIDESEVEEAETTFDPGAARAHVIERAGAAASVVVEEAEALLADALRRSDRSTLLITRAAHLEAVERHLEDPASVEAFDVVPEKSIFSRFVPWLFSGAIVLAFILGFAFADTEKMTDAVLTWSATNMIFSAVGALIASAHPLAVVATSISSPVVSLNPAVGAGMVGALVQALVAPPTVRDMDRVGDDITELSGWWRNRLSRIVLVLVFANVFSTIGSFVAIAWFGVK